ncbi:MAG: hypothetical protein WCC87_19590 [Candidatus Korobacteraceae bacterium]
MSERAIAIGEASLGSVGAAQTFPFQRAYVPLKTFLLVLLIGMWLVHEAEPLAAPPPELRKQTGVNPALSPQEAELARAVIEPGFASRGGREQLLFIGNSQTMAIPYAQPWDISTPQWFQVLLSRRDPGGVDVHRGSLGGMTLPEVVVRMVDFVTTAQTPAVVIFDLRPEILSDLSIRNEIRDEAKQPAVAAALRRLAASNPDLPRAAHVVEEMVSSDKTSQAAISQVTPWPNRLENTLQATAERSKVFAQRDLFIDMANITFRKYRNRLFGVTSASTRPLERSIYLTNLELLSEALQYLHQKDTRTIIYFGPIRRILPNPNPRDSLAQVHRDIADLAKRCDAELLDYSRLVPESYWTDYEPSRLNQLTGDAGQHDFAHFRAEAHQMVAKKLVQDVGGQIYVSTH